jgi:hypothetical protein
MNATEAVVLVRRLREDLPQDYVPPSEGTRSKSHMVLPAAIVKGVRRGYISRIANQVNGCYEQGWYDGCAVMMRRLLETLIIEVFEHFEHAQQIKNSNGDFLYLADLISAMLSQPSWNLGRNTKAALPRLKSLGDQSAHSRRFVAHREDVDKVQGDFRVVVQELLFLAELG